MNDSLRSLMTTQEIYRHHNNVMAMTHKSLVFMELHDCAEKMQILAQDEKAWIIFHELIHCASDMGWFNRANILPEEHQKVIVYTVNGVMMSAEYITGADGKPGWYQFPGCIPDEVVVLWHAYPHPPMTQTNMIQ